MNNFASNPMYSPMSYQPATNVIYVSSLDEALMRTDARNADMIYFDQDKDVFYRIKVDMDGRKTWAQFNYTVPNNKENIPATKADIDQLLTKIQRLEQRVLVEVEVENNNAQYNG